MQPRAFSRALSSPMSIRRRSTPRATARAAASPATWPVAMHEACTRIAAARHVAADLKALLDENDLGPGTAGLARRADARRAAADDQHVARLVRQVSRTKRRIQTDDSPSQQQPFHFHFSFRVFQSRNERASLLQHHSESEASRCESQGNSPYPLVSASAAHLSPQSSHLPLWHPRGSHRGNTVIMFRS